MKRALLSIISLFVVLSCFAEDYTFKKVAVFDNTKEGLVRRPPVEVGEDGDATGNYICFSDDGELYIQNWDRYQLLKVNQKDYSLEVIHDLKFLHYSRVEKLRIITDNYYLFDTSNGGYRSTLVNSDFNKIYTINETEVRIDDYSYGAYYDFDTDILFYLSRKNFELCCIVHPSTDLKQNKKNVRNHERTIEILQKKTDIDVGDLRYVEGKGLFKGDNEIYFEGFILNGNKYKKLDDTEFSLRINGKRILINTNDETGIEQIESSAIHPSGDLYVLRYNKTTQLHTLYRVENTWDIEWRNEWYSKHQ